MSSGRAVSTGTIGHPAPRVLLSQTRRSESALPSLFPTVAISVRSNPQVKGRALAPISPAREAAHATRLRVGRGVLLD